MYKAAVDLGHLPAVMIPHLSAIRIFPFHTSSIRVVGFREKRKFISVYNPPRYIRLNNTPNHTALHEKLKLIEGGHPRPPSISFSFEVEGGTNAAESLIANLQLPNCAPSLGGVKSLITQPATDSLIRFSAGIEDAEDPIHDLETGLSRI
jgi:cystathionine beta-lyase/cystathionine gamma-synthase